MLPSSVTNAPADPYLSTRAFNALPALNCRTNFSGTTTFSPVFGFLAVRGGRWFISKLPKPRISIRCPLAKLEIIASNIALMAISASFAVSCGERLAIRAFKFDLVIRAM